MLQMQGYRVVEYANESTSEAVEKVNILSSHDIPSFQTFHGETAVIGNSVWQKFDKKLREELFPRYNPTIDIVCWPFGNTHPELHKILSGLHIETGIGYPNTFLPYRVFESFAWLHYHCGKAGSHGSPYSWVVPNYFDLDDWKPSFVPGKYLLYFGRIDACKGLHTVLEIAQRTDQTVVLCGQGDPTPWTSKCDKLVYIPPVTGAARSELLRNATALLMPTNFVEPFGGSGVEGLLCGTPLLASDFGAFTETVQNGLNGYRCKTLGDWLEATEIVGVLNRERIAQESRHKYALETCGKQYDRIFKQMHDLHSDGWYTLNPRNI